MNTENSTIGDRIAELRREKGLSQVEFAQKMGVSLASVCSWEQDKREPRKFFRKALCEYFGVDMNYLTATSNVKNAYSSRGVMIKIFNIDDASVDDKYAVDSMILPETLLISDDCFAEMIKESNMAKFGIANNSIAILKETAALFDNEIQLFNIDGKFVFKKVAIKGNAVYLEDDKETLVYSNRNDLKTLGVCMLIINKSNFH